MNNQFLCVVSRSDLPTLKDFPKGPEISLPLHFFSALIDTLLGFFWVDLFVIYLSLFTSSLFRQKIQQRVTFNSTFFNIFTYEPNPQSKVLSLRDRWWVSQLRRQNEMDPSP